MACPFVTLLLHMNNVGTPGTFIDSASALTISAQSAIQQASVVKFGAGAGYFPADDANASKALRTLVSAAGPLDLHLGDFTIECEINLDVIGGTDGTGHPRLKQGVWYGSDFNSASANPNPTGTEVWVDSLGNVTARLWQDSGTFTTWTNTHVVLTTGGWHHIALVRNGNSFVLYVDGQGTDSGTAITTLSAVNGSHYFYIGSLFNDSNASLGGHMDEFRVTKGLAQYTTNFTPPTVAFSDCVSTTPSARPKWVQFGRAIRLPHVLGGRGRFQHEKEALQTFIIEARTNKVFAKYIFGASHGDSNIRVDIHHPSVSTQPVDSTTFTDTVQ